MGLALSTLLYDMSPVDPVTYFSVAFLLIVVSLCVVWGLPSAAFAEKVSVTVDSGFQQRAGAKVTIKDSNGKEVKGASGTTAVPPTGPASGTATWW